MLFISDAMAAQPAAQPNGSAGSMVFMLGFIVIAYLLLLRPQMKRAKEHRQLISSLAQGDEVVTTGGIIGRIKSINDSFLTLTISKDVEVTVQKHSISNALPKGTVKTF